VVVDGAALADGVGDGGEVVVRQDDVGGLLRRLGALDAHGDADVGAFEGGGVVDAVAGHGHDLAAGLQCRDQAELVLGGGAGEDVVALRRVGELPVVHQLQFGAGDGGDRAVGPDVADAHFGG